MAQPIAVSGIAPIKHANIRDDVYAVLRRGILRHDYPPGHRFDLNDLTSRLRVSRTPVKEALHRLEGEGLVDNLPRRGTFVSTPDGRNIEDGYGVRLALELHAADAVVRAITPAQLARLRSVRSGMADLLEAPDFGAVVEQYIQLDQTFHIDIMALAGNRRMIDTYKIIGGPLQLARILSQFSADDYRTYTEVEHDAIVQALDERNVSALKAAMTAHIVRAQQRVLKSLGGPHPTENS